jgi:protein-disulfide isomerase
MNTKRIAFWSIFVVVLVLVVWGLIVAENKPAPSGVPNLGTPAPVTAADHVEGSTTASVTLIEYGDFQCPACSEYAPIVGQLFTAASSTLRVVFRNFPLPQHANAMIAAQAAEAASIQGKFWEMYQAIYAGQASWQDQSDADARATFNGYADTLGLDKTRFDADIDSPEVKQKIASDQAEGQSLGIDYTPTFFVNGKVITNPQGYDAFKAVIDAAAK